jgi:hypothetical protein
MLLDRRCPVSRSQRRRHNRVGEGHRHRPAEAELRPSAQFRAVSKALSARAKRSRFGSTTGATTTTSGRSCTHRACRRPAPERPAVSPAMGAAVAVERLTAAADAVRLSRLMGAAAGAGAVSRHPDVDSRSCNSLQRLLVLRRSPLVSGLSSSFLGGSRAPVEGDRARPQTTSSVSSVVIVVGRIQSVVE